MESNLVIIQRNEGRAGTKIIADGFNRRHEQVTRLVKKYQGHFEKINTLKKSATGGKTKKFEEYFLTFKQLLFLISIMKNGEHTSAMKLEMIMNSGIFNALEILDRFDSGESSQRYIYAAIDKSRRVKIGISNDPVTRVKQLNVGNADRLELVFTKKADASGYQDEIILHRKCDAFRIRSEWFTNEALEVLNEEANK